MDNKDRLIAGLATIKKNRTRLTNKENYIKEEIVKHMLIQPLLSSLGYDVFNSEVIHPEYNIAGTSKKVDYFVKHNEYGAFIIEAKALGVNLDKHVTQLADYFDKTTVPFGILTDGVVYRFYIGDEQGQMQATPTYTFNTIEHTERDLDILLNLSREQYSSVNTFIKLRTEGVTVQVKTFLQSQEILEDVGVITALLKAVNAPVNETNYSKYKAAVQEALNEVLDLETQQKQTRKTPVRTKGDLPLTEHEYAVVKVLQTILLQHYTEEETETVTTTKNGTYVNVFLPNTKTWFVRIYSKTTTPFIMLNDKLHGRSDKGTRLKYNRPQEVNYHTKDILGIVDNLNKLTK